MTKKLPATPKWLSQKPDGSKKRLIASEVNVYVKKCADDGNKLESSTKLIPGFIAHLAKENADFGKIKSRMQVTTFSFIENMRLQIRYAITHVTKELKAAKATKNQTADDNVSNPESQNAAAKDVQEDEGDVELSHGY